MDTKHRHNRILFAGLNTIDIQYLMGFYPDENTKTKAERNEVRPGGPATNAAITCASLGSKVDLFTPIGKHMFSEFLFKNIEQYSVHILDPIAEVPSNPVFSSIVTCCENASRTVFYYNPENRYEFDIIKSPDLSQYKLALFDGFWPEMAIPLIKKCRETGVITVLDGGSWKECTTNMLAYIDIAICSNDFETPDGPTPDAVFNYLHQHKIEHIAITRGEKSILYSTMNKKGEIQIDPIDVVDTLGAGDIFHGAFCHYYMMNLNFAESLRLASQIASESCQTFGTR